MDQELMIQDEPPPNDYDEYVATEIEAMRKKEDLHDYRNEST